MINIIQELKEKIGQAAEVIIADGIGLKKSGNKYHCPNATAHKHGDKNPSMSWDPNALQFYCFTCGEKIDIYRYFREFKKLEHQEVMENYYMNYNNCNFNESTLNTSHMEILEKNQIEYLVSRGISEDVQKIFKLGNIAGNIAIPYLETDKVVGIKVRNLMNTSPKYYSIKGSKFGLFNKDNVNEKPGIIVTEGEFDCMIVCQAGFDNVVSVGTGANSLKGLLQQERSFIDSFDTLIVLSDNDVAGQNMRNDFVKEFGYKVKLPSMNLYNGCKDINEVFLKHGKEQVKKIIDSAAIKIEGMRNLDLQPYEGIKSIDGKYIPTGIVAVDYALNDLSPGLVTLITGRANGGKSTFVNQIMVNAIDKGNKVLLIAGEGLQEILINNLYKTVIGREKEYFEYRKINKRIFVEPTQEALIALKIWHKSKLTIFNKGDSDLKSTDELFGILNIQIKTSRPDLVIIDNLMSVLSVEKAVEKLEKQADFMQRCCDLAKSEKLHIILVLHPNKTVQKGNSMDFEQISGTQDLANKADNIISVKRNYNEEDLVKGYDGEIEVLKNRYFSDLPKVNVYFDKDTCTLLQIQEQTGDRMAYELDWKKYLA